MGRLGWLAVLIGGAALLALLFNDGTTVEATPRRLVGLFALLLFVAVGARGLLFGRASEATRNVVVWLAISGALLAGYAYRAELQDVGHRVTLGLVPGSSVTRLTADGTARVQIGRDRAGHFSVEGDVEGTAVRFLVDTGATVIALSASDAQRIGFEESELRYSQPIMTANGRAFAAPVLLERVSVGGIERRDVQASVAAPGALAQSLLGMNFVGTLSSFEIRGDRLILSD